MQQRKVGLKNKKWAAALRKASAVASQSCGLQGGCVCPPLEDVRQRQEGQKDIGVVHVDFQSIQERRQGCGGAQQRAVRDFHAL